MQLDFYEQLYENTEKKKEIVKALVSGTKNLLYFRDQIVLDYRNSNQFDEFTTKHLATAFEILAVRVDYLRFSLEISMKAKNILPVVEPKPIDSLTEGFLGVYNERSPLEWYNISKRDINRLEALILANKDMWSDSKICMRSIELIQDYAKDVIFTLKTEKDVIYS